MKTIPCVLLSAALCFAAFGQQTSGTGGPDGSTRAMNKSEKNVKKSGKTKAPKVKEKVKEKK